MDDHSMYAIPARAPQELSISEKINDNGTRTIECLGRSAIRSSFPDRLGLKMLLVKRSDSESMNVLANGKMRRTGVPRTDLREAISESI